jgi:hypothetical protein
MNNKIDLKVVNQMIILFISLVKFKIIYEYILILIYVFYLFIFI